MIQRFQPDSVRNETNSLCIFAGGFENRVKGILNNFQKSREKVLKYSFILEYTTHKEANKENLHFLNQTLNKCSTYCLDNVVIDIDNLLISQNNLRDRLKEIPQDELGAIYVDISGMTNFAILLTLKIADTTFPDKRIFVLYTEAKNYYPTKDEKDEILTLAQKRDDQSIIKLSEKLQASGSRETLILTDFKGTFREDLPIALIFFVGYEPSRAIGLLETYRPHIVIPCYGESPHKYFEWRTKFSIDLHKKFGVFEHCPYLKKNIIVSTFDVPGIINELEKIYVSEVKGVALYEGFNIAITPQCSKLQTIATYLFCQLHPDVQVVFCLPGRYNPKRYSKGIGKSWVYPLS